jgi:hypothetical protein
MTIANPSTLVSLIAVLLSIGCADLTEDPTTVELRDFEIVEPWDTVLCSAGTRCYAHTPSGDELWTAVTSWCSLEAQLNSGEYFYEKASWQYSCNMGGHPVSFDEYRCFATSATSTRCYGGTDGWYTQVEPVCLTAVYNTAAWGAGSCDPDDFYGVTDFDTVNMKPLGKLDYGRATESTDAFYVMPQCALPPGLGVAPDPFDC